MGFIVCYGGNGKYAFFFLGEWTIIGWYLWEVGYWWLRRETGCDGDLSFGESHVI